MEKVVTASSSTDSGGDVAAHVEMVAKLTKTPELKEVATKVREFDARWGTNSKKK
jgi:hypothetical protein